MKTYIDKYGEVKPVFLRTEFNYDMDEASEDSALICPEPSMTKQEFVDECDINTIIERFGITGELPQIDRMPLQDEFLEATTYQEALHKMMEADTAFMLLPASERTRFDNDPGKFVDFVSDPKNLEEVRGMGLAMPEKPKTAPMEVRVVPDPEKPA